MAEKRIQENPIPDVSTAESDNKDKTMKADKTDKAPQLPPPVTSPTPSQSLFTKNPPNDLYRRLLPAALFLLTFVTVMTMLLIYMDTVALGAQQFRLNMTRDYELARIGQRSPALIQYVRQLHLSTGTMRRAQQLTVPEETDRVPVVDRYFGDQHNGTYVDLFPRGGRNPTALYLERVRGWGGVAVRAAAADFLSARAAPIALHACLSPSQHPREVSYPEGDSREGAFMSRVLCLPLLTVLAAAERTATDYVAIGGDAVLPALHVLPFEDVSLKLLEIYSTDPLYRNKTTTFLGTKNYTVAATFDDSVMYVLNDKV